MSEKFFIVTSESKLNKEYFDHQENRKQVIATTKQFYVEQGIESDTEFCPYNNVLYVIPSKADKEKFANQFCKYSDNYGLMRIKENSKLGKAWVNILHSKSLTIMRSPSPQFYFNSMSGGGNYRLFDIDGVLYCSYQNPKEFDTPKGFAEIKASEFFKIAEDYEAKQKAEDTL